MKTLRKVLFFIMCMALGGLVGVLAARYGFKSVRAAHWNGWQLSSLLLLLPVAWLIAVLAHELGHVLMGRLRGFVFHWLAVGPLMWKREGGQVRFSWNKDLNTAGGMALCVPPDSHDLRRRFMAFALGGPLASVVFAGLTLSIYFLSPPATSPVGRVLSAALLFLPGAVSTLLAFVTLLPMHTGGFYSDGARVLNLWRGGPAGQLEVALFSALVPSIAGTRPRDLPRPLLEAGAALPQELPFKLYLFHYLYLIALDQSQLEQAADYLAQYRARLGMMPAALQAGVWLESAFFAAAYQHDLPAAQAFQAQARLSSHIQPDVPARVAAALARAAGDAEQARTSAQLALLHLPKNLDQGSARLYAEWLTETVAWAQTQQVAEGTTQPV